MMDILFQAQMAALGVAIGVAIALVVFTLWIRKVGDR